MEKKIIRDLSSNRDVQPRFCDAIRDDDGKLILEIKSKRGINASISWDDLKYQVEPMVSHH